jgi:DNA-binding Lrp family transcriptional regulator
MRSTAPPIERGVSLDRTLLAHLAADARLPIAQLAQDAGVSRATAYKRVAALADGGAIRQFAAVLDRRALGLQVSALVMASVDQRRWRAAREAIEQLASVRYAALVTGDRDLLLIVDAPDIDSLRDVVLREINGLPSVRSTRTLLVLEEVVDRVNPADDVIRGAGR